MVGAFCAMVAERGFGRGGWVLWEDTWGVCLVVRAAQGSRTGVGNGEVVGVMALEVYSKFYRGQ